MIDKIIMNVDITIDAAVFENLEERFKDLAARNKLQRCSAGNTVFYKSTPEAKTTGLYMQTKGGKLKINCSLHKQFYLRVFGRLDNSGQFTMYNAKWMINNLFEEIGIEPKNGFIIQYEIGLNIPTDRPPMEYIELIRGIGEKPFYIDAYFKKNRQKTTDKSRTIRKYFKVYDKGYEMSDRKRQPHDNDPNILRIETVFRREKIKVTEFFSKKHLNKIATQFIKDWQTIEFEREIRGAKGTRSDQTLRAKQIFSMGIEAYMNLINEQRKKGELSERSYRTAREFARDWNEHKKHFTLIPSELEKEYREKLESTFRKMNDVEM